MMRWNSVSSTDSASSVRLGVSGEHRPLRMPRYKSACNRDVHGLDSSMDWIGLGWIGSDDCYVQNYDGLCFSAKQTKTVLCND